MRLRTLTIHGITRFDRPTTVDFGALGPGIVAVVGPNGAGKTTILECSGPGALYRMLPTRTPSSLSSWTSVDGARLDLSFEVGGVVYDARIRTAGADRGAFVSVDGAERVSGRLREYDEFMVDLMGPAEAFLASVFGAQSGVGRFGDLAVARRRAIFRRYLGLDRLEMLHGEVVERLRRHDTERPARIEEEISELADRRLAVVEELRQAGEEVAGCREAERKAREEYDRVAKVAPVVVAVAKRDLAMDTVLETEGLLERLRAQQSDVEAAPHVDANVLRRQFREGHAALRRLEEQALRVDALTVAAERARKIEEETSDAAASVENVPCRGVGQYADCPLLCGAVEAAGRLFDVAQDTVDALRKVEEVKADLEKSRREAPTEDHLGRIAGWIDEAVEERVCRERLSRRVAEVNDGLMRAYEVARQAHDLCQRTLDDSGCGENPDLPAADDVERLSRSAAEARDRVEAAVRRETTAAGTLGMIEAGLKALKVERHQLHKAGSEYVPLTLLEDALGPYGVQAYEIAAAGPRVSELANDLLASCYGGRFSLEISTLRDLRSREGVAEDVGIRVYDAHYGVRHESMSGVSAGERVIVDEALRLALSLFATERRGTVCETLWRDETIGGLDQDNAPRYVDMLRRAREIGGFHQVLYVAHDVRVAMAADAVLEVRGDGTVDQVLAR